MKTLYLECKMGAAGDMLMGALYELLPDQAAFLETMNRLADGVTVKAAGAESCFIHGTHMEVRIRGEEEHTEDVHAGHTHEHEYGHAGEHDELHAHRHDHGHNELHDHEHTHGHDELLDHGHDHGHAHHHHHASMKEIRGIISGMPVPEEVKAHVNAVYDLIAEAEAAVHGRPVTEIHLHEVGALDAITDITGVCLAMHLLKPERVVASPVHLGSGLVRCAHGIMPVPAPATARLLQGIPCYTGDIDGELCTPTGAALLKHFVQSFGSMPVMAMEKTGYGLGHKEFPLPNAVRAFLGTSQGSQEIDELCCHIDDMTAEALSYAGERLMEQGALDVSFTPMTMKKGRPGTALTLICRPEDEERLAQAVLRETSTNGVRCHTCRRYILTPSVRTVDTAYGPVRIKCADGTGIHREKPEYADAAAAAEKAGLPFETVYREILRQLGPQAER